jgi:UDP-N-acetylmuramate--alanine ligase
MKSDVFHMIGIGGIGMSALARVLLQQGYVVRGTDSSPSYLLEDLVQEGAQVWIGHQEDLVSEGTVVYSSAIQGTNQELQRAKQKGLKLLHRSDLLHSLMQGKRSLQVTGTHGKTTTSSLLSSVLIRAGFDPSFVVGGIVQSLKTNGAHGQGPYFVAESDESDGSFLKTPSFGAIVTNCENDHLDYWKTSESLIQAFQEFFSNVTHPDHLFWCGDDPILRSIQKKSSGFSYGFSSHVDLQISDFRANGQGICFDIAFQGKVYPDIELSLLGRHNALNGAAVFGLCLTLQVPETIIRQAFKEFLGVKRRLEKKGESHGVICFDDYGHHPTEIQATLKALRGFIGEKRMVVLFQPHRFSRTLHLWDDFLTSFQEADLLCMTDIYSAGEAPIAGISSEKMGVAIREKTGQETIVCSKENVVEKVSSLLRPFDVLLTIGAGSVTSLGIPILEMYEKIAPQYKVGFLFGGASSEHCVSLMSAREIFNSLDKAFYQIQMIYITTDGFWHRIDSIDEPLPEKRSSSRISPEIVEELSRCDVVIPVLHGPQGEDGMTQAFLKTLGVPYVGCSYTSGALCMNKVWTKQIAVAHQIPVVPYVEISRLDYEKNPNQLLDLILDKLTFPVWVKPNHLGSSFGVSRAVDCEQVLQSANKAFALDDYILVEQEVRGREIEFALIGNQIIRIAEPCVVLSQGSFYGYDEKYGSNGFQMEIPAKISPLQKKKGLELAQKMYLAARCTGLARIDFFLDEQGCFWMNEINPFPGFTKNSAYPAMWEKSGVNRRDLMNELVVLAFARQRDSQ